jgi:hypothetical protein
MKRYTVDEIRNYLLSQDSMGDILYYLNEDNIDKANDELNEETKEVEDFNSLT